MSEFRVLRRDDDHWYVGLPHQCDGWQITSGSYYDGVPYDDAVRALTKFIDEAIVALMALRLRQEADPW